MGYKSCCKLCFCKGYHSDKQDMILMGRAGISLIVFGSVYTVQGLEVDTGWA